MLEGQYVIATTGLIDALAADLTPVRRLRSPLTRAACWLLLAALTLALLAVSQGVRPDLAQRLQDPTFVARVGGALLTGVFAAVAAFMLSLPDRSRLWLLLPAPGLTLWLSAVRYQCLTSWVSFDPNGIHLGVTAQCFATLALTSFPLSLVMLNMLRYATPLRPTGMILIGSLAVAAIGATALSLVYDHPDPTVLALTWSLGMPAALAGLGTAFGRNAFSFVAPVQR